jgi:hypothetical protein
LLLTVTLLAALHEPRLTVHVNVFEPDDSPLTALVRRLATLMVDEPTVLHKPEPWTGLTASRLAASPQTVCAAPAVENTWLLVNTTSETAEHTPRLTVQWKVLAPKPKPLTALWLVLEDKIEPVPLAKLHEPVPELGTTASKVPWPVQLALEEPPSETTPLLTTVTVALLLHWPFTTVHTNWLLPADRPLTVVLAELMSPKVDDPVLDQWPLPIDGTTAARDALFVQTLTLLPALAAEVLLFVTFT